MSDKEFLEWIRDRIVHVYGESPNTDFVLRLGDIAQALQSGEPVGVVDERLHDLSERLRATDSQNRYLSLSEQHEICDFIDDLPEGNLYTTPQPVVPERLESLLHTVQGALHDAYQNADLVCCGKSMMDCCGSPVPEWSEADQKIMDVLSPIQRELSDLLSAGGVRHE